MAMKERKGARITKNYKNKPKPYFLLKDYLSFYVLVHVLTTNRAGKLSKSFQTIPMGGD
jgi:hypothetical protein